MQLAAMAFLLEFFGVSYQLVLLLVMILVCSRIWTPCPNLSTTSCPATHQGCQLAMFCAALCCSALGKLQNQAVFTGCVKRQRNQEMGHNT